jgi:lysophospholipase L1-like esterase
MLVVPMQAYEPEVRALERDARGVRTPSRVVVFYGSSSIRLWTSLVDDFSGVPVVNRAFGGSTLAACSWFFWRLVRSLPARSIVLYAGDNDVGNGDPAPLVLEQLKHFLRQVDMAFGELPVGFISIKPSPARWHLVDTIHQVNAGARQVIEQRPRGIFVDVAPLMLDRGRPRTDLYEPDGLHLSRAGYAVWRDALLRHRVPLLEDALAPRR